MFSLKHMLRRQAIAFLASALRARFCSTTGGVGDLAALIAAHRLRAASAIAFRPAALMVRLRWTDVTAAIEFLRSKGVTVEPIEKSVVEG